MCTAVSFKSKDHYFGRNLDIEFFHGEQVVITPKNYHFSFTDREVRNHYAIIGAALVVCGYPLYFDGTNEKGLSVAALAFKDNAAYHPYCKGKVNLAPFEVIPYLLSLCANVSEARKILENANIFDKSFSDEYANQPLHYIVSDSQKSIVIESTVNGLEIYENPYGVLTNNPKFYYHSENVKNYMNLSSGPAHNLFSENLTVTPYSNGMGAIGLPGDLSSASRFVRALFTKENTVCRDEEKCAVSAFFHILDSVCQTRGCTVLDSKEYEITLYSSCCNTSEGIYYYKTYENSRISAVYMNNENINSDSLIAYDMNMSADFLRQN